MKREAMKKSDASGGGRWTTISRLLPLSGLLLVLTMLASGCREASTMNGGARKPETGTTIHYLTAIKENEGSARIISELAAQFQQLHPDARYEFENVAQTNLSQKVELLAASNDLPALFSYESGKPLLDIIDSDAALDLEGTFRKLGIFDKLNPAAVDLLKAQVDGAGLYALPLEMNIEGFWYNKAIFARFGLAEPKNWDEMLADAELLKQHDVQPFSVAGKEKWPITRLINAYAIREYGADAMERVDKGSLKLTDPGFVEAARVVQQMGLNGYLGQEINTVDMATSIDMFLQGKAAMFYMGSWELRDFNDTSKNQIGADNIGFFNIPLVKGGKGTLDEYSMNAGLTTSFSKAAYNDQIGQWMTYVFQGYGDLAMSELGMITGFKVEHFPENMPALTQMVQSKMDAAKTGALWFEARFNSKSQSVAWDNAQLLVTSGAFTPQQYMETLQATLDEQP